MPPDNNTETSYRTAHEFAEKIGVEIPSEQARVIAAALTLISEGLGYQVVEKKQRTSKPATGLAAATKRKVYQSYTVKAFDPALEYYFTQFVLLLQVAA